MQGTLTKVKNLEKFIQKYGEDTIMSGTITKMVEYRLQKYHEQIKKLDGDLKKFEQTYKKNSSIFFKEFKKGSLEDNMDFIEWSSLYQMRNRLIEKKAGLEGI